MTPGAARFAGRPRATLAAAIWSAAYGALGLLWALGLPGFPFGEAGDPSAVATLFPEATPWPGGLAIAGLGGASAVVAAGLAHARPSLRVLRGATLLAALIAVALIAIVPDYRVLLAVAYLPLIVLGAPFDWPPSVDIGLVLPWPVVNQFLVIAGGVLWAGVAVETHRRARDEAGTGGDAIADRLVRAHRPATAVAVAVPLVYAATRYAWALGIPVGLSEDLYRQGQAFGLWTVGAGLATVAVVGALLTLGLAQDWGVRFPRRLPWLGGRPVPTNLAVVPALVAAVLVTSAGMMFVRLVVTGRLGEVFVFAADVGWAALAPELLWPAWGVALAVAALGYRERRRRSEPPANPSGIRRRRTALRRSG